MPLGGGSSCIGVAVEGSGGGLLRASSSSSSSESIRKSSTFSIASWNSTPATELERTSEKSSIVEERRLQIHGNIWVVARLHMFLPNRVSRVYPEDWGSIQKVMGLFRKGWGLSRSGAILIS